jgi:nucleotide-binding universal stress UspA family protein
MFSEMEKYKILVPVDFSPYSVNALKNAVSLAKKTDSFISIVHAVMVPVVYGEDDMESSGWQAEEMEKGIKDNLESMTNLVPDLKDIDHEFKLEYALSPDAIITFTLQNEVDLIVMGTRGKNRKGRALLGSNTFAVINSVKCPVLAIPEDGNINDVKKIILAVDYDEIPPYASFEPLIKLARLFGAQVNIIHIGKEMKLTSEELLEARNLEQYFKTVKHQYKYLFGGDEEKTISTYLKNENARVLAIISKEHTMVEKLQHRSLTKKIVSHLKIPLLVLHENSG